MDNTVATITKQTSIKRAERAFALEVEIKELKYQVGRNFLEMGKALKEIRDNGYYQDLGFETITEWLSSPDISISARWAWDFMSIYEVLVLNNQIEPEKILAADYSKLHQILPVIRTETNKEVVEEWVEKAQLLRRVDLKREIQEYRGEDKQQIADASVAHISVSLLFDWHKLLLDSSAGINKEACQIVTSEIEGEIKKATGLLDIADIKGKRF